LLFLAATRSSTVAASAASQTPTASARARPSLRQDATFTHITIEQGLSDQRVQAIVQDRTGFIWFGTSNGLSRFDGYNVVAYRHDPANPHSLSSNFIEVLYEDRSGTLWVGTWSGLNAFDRRTERFTRYMHNRADPRSLSHNRVRVIHEDRAGGLWVGTDGGGLNRFDPATGAFTHYRHDPNNPHSLSVDQVDSLFEDSSGALWIGTHGSGVDVYNPQHRAFTLYRRDPKAPISLASNNVSAVYEDQDGVLWIGTRDRGLERLDRRSGQVLHYPPDPKNPERLGHPDIAALQQDQTGALWVGTYGGGLYRLDPVRGSFTTYRHDPANPQSLSSDIIADLHMDRSGVLWVGTRGGGLNRFDPARGAFTAYRLDPSNPQSLSSDTVWALAEDQSGSIWIGTLGGGLNRLEPATGHITRYQHDPQNPASLSDDSIADLHMDRSGILWVGTVGGGLDRFDPARGTFTHYRERDGLASDRIMAILEDGDASGPAAGNLWIATGRGLSKLDRDRTTFQTYDTTDGLPQPAYNRGRYRTRSGELLMSSTHGLLAFDPTAVWDDAYVPPVVFTNFLLANKPVAIGATSPLRQAVDQTDTIALTYADRVISFEFAALNYRAPRQSRYRYKLEGFDDDWTEVGSTQRLVTYTNLDPGRYVFRVTAASADGVWNEAGRAIALVVTPPWWATWWCRGLALVLSVGGAFGMYAWRVKSLQRQQRALEAEIVERPQAEEALRASQDSLRRSNVQIQDLAGRLITAQEEERSRIARELHDNVNQQPAALSIALSSLKRRLPLEADEAQQEVTRLQQQTIVLSEAIRHLSHELHPGVLQHAGLVAALQGNCAEFGRQHGIDLTFHADAGLEEISADVALCLYRVAQEALHNIAQHAGARRAEVALIHRDDILELRIADDGQGFDLEVARRRGGLGLISIDERVRLVQGYMWIVTEPQRGTELRVWVPLYAGARTPQEEENAPRQSPVGA
jgi:signal transduction histidine kinase/ligand-binding sensor domain-containing protein